MMLGGVLFKPLVPRLMACMRTIVFVLALFFGGSAHSESTADAMTIWYFQKDERFDYRIELLQHALSYTREQLPKLSVKATPETLTDLRANMRLSSGEQAFIVSSFPGRSLKKTNIEPIQPSILAGMLGFRLLLVRPDKVDYLSQLRSRGQFKSKAIAGFGAQWQDLKILQDNNIAVRTSSQYLGLFDMLASRRFDYFPRGLAEVFQELEVGDRRQLFQIHPDIAIYYPYPVYFHINTRYHDIAKRIELGLLKAKQDGSFRALFRRHHQFAIDWLSRNHLHIILLQGATQASLEPVDNMDWWLPGELHKTLSVSTGHQCPAL